MKDKIKWVYVFWSGFILNLATAIILVNTLPFKSPGEKTGFILSIVLLYLVPYGILTLYTRIVLAIIRKRVQKNQTSGLLPVKIVLHLFPILAFYGALDLLLFTVPKAVSENDFMKLNGISMALGLLLAGIRTLYQVRKYFSA